VLFVIRDCNPGIPNPGIGDALIPGFRNYEKCTHKMPEFYGIFARKIPIPRVLGAIPGSKAESERIRTNTNYVIMVDIDLRA